MRMKFTFRSLLVAAGLLMGSMSAWAEAGDEVTNVDIDFSNAIENKSIAGTVGTMTWTQEWSPAPSITSDGYLTFGNWDGAVVELENNNIESKDVVTIKFELAFGKLKDKHVGLEFRDINGENILTQWFDAYYGTFEDSNPLNLDWNYMYHGANSIIWERRVYFTITLDYANQSITTKTTCYLSGASKAATDGEFIAALPSTTALGYFVLTGNINNADRVHAFDNLKITTTKGDYSTATADYTIKYVCDDVEVKESATRNGDVDASITLLPSDKNNFTLEDGSKRYIYVSDDADEKTIEEDGNTVVTVTFREAEKWAYTVTSSYNNGTVLDWSTAGEIWEDLTSVTVNYPRYQADRNILVEKGDNDDLIKTFNVENNNFTYDIEYTATDIKDLYFLSEAEDLGTSLSSSSPASFPNRCSNKTIIFGAEGTLFTLPAGKYIITLGTIGGDGNTHTVKYNAFAGEQQIITDGICSSNFFTKLSSEEITLTEETAIKFTCSDPASSRGIDLVYVQKTGDVAIELESSETLEGYKTFYNASGSYEVDENTTIYSAAYNEASNTVTLTEVGANIIPAGTPVIVKTESADYTITLTPTTEESEGDFDGNELKAADAAGEISNAYILARTDDKELGFYNYIGSFEVGEVYLPVGKALGIKYIAIAVDGVATAIETVEAAEAEAGVTYNVAGQQVGSNYKGIVIKNGKKYLNK